MFAAQRAAMEKEKRKTAKSAVKTENSKKFGGQLFKKTQKYVPLQKHWPKTNEVSGHRQVNAPLKNFDTKTRTETKLNNTDTIELNNTGTTELNNETT